MYKAFLSFAIICLCASSCGGAKQSAPPNIVLIMADDLGIRDLGCYGSDYYRTPNLDQLAEQGMKFTRAYTASHVCSPTRASMLTGRYPHRVRITDALPWDRLTENPKMIPPDHLKELPSELPSFAKSLREAGYRTAIFGKWHLGNEYNFFKQGGHKDYGFDDAFSGTSQEKKRDKSVDELTDRSIEFLEANQEGPFMLYLTHHTPHVPLASPPEDEALYNNIKKGRFQKNQKYAGMISHLDQSTKVILDKLTELGLDENTLVIFTSDNGSWGKISSNKPYRGSKGDLYEGGVRVPLLVRWPGHIVAGSVFDAPVFSTDYFPTYLELAGLNLMPDAHHDGQSMLPVWNGKKQAGKRTFFWHFPHRQNPASSVMEGDWKLVHNIVSNHYELFDLKNDPYEENDCKSVYPEKTQRLSRLLEKHLQSIGAQRMRPNPEYNPSRPRGKQRSYGIYYWEAGGEYQPVKDPYPSWFKEGDNK